MAAVARERINGYTIRHGHGFERARAEDVPDSRDISPMPRNSDMPRSASYTFLGEAKEHTPYNHPSIVTIKGSFCEQDLIASADDLADVSPPDSSGWTTPDEVAEPKVPADQARDLIAELQKSPKITIQRFTQATEDERTSIDSSMRRGSTGNTSLESDRTASTLATTPGSVTPRPRPSTQTSFSKRLNRRSWYGSSPPSTTSSRSPSPPKKETILGPHEVGQDAAPAPSPVGALLRRKSLVRRMTSKSAKEAKSAEKGSASSPEDEDGPGERPSVTRRSTLLRKKSRPVSQLFKGAKDENAPPVPPMPRMPSFPKSFSTDRLPSFRSQTPQPDRAAPMPRLLSSDRAPSAGMSIPIRKKDELWTVFRGLDGDYAKFASKSVAFKANVVRATLLPFLRMYATHASNRTLRPEDLDRRGNILNKWWTGLIEMLHGRNNASISGTDRPVILDGIAGIMERSEWRLAPSPFCPLNQRAKGMNTPRNRSNTSLSSGASEFLTDSVHHNIRNIFIQNLSAQMAFVVDKMSLRNASASLVTFCGKACAYAFMFVPGMADVLVRLWDLQIDPLRRVLDENGIGKFDNLSDTATGVIASFPPALQQLGFFSLMKYMRKLRTPPPLPLGTANIQWWGHWLERWSGRDSDLFYVFVKHFHILVTDFLQPDVSKKDRMCAPGMLLVHAQILHNLDATIHRDTARSQPDPTAVGSSPTFDDVLSDPDAVATALPLPPTNAIRIMAENRLIMLIRDFLSERTSDHPIARQLFAESFNDLLQTAAKGTSTFDHAACYTLLDFLEEALTILVRFEHIKEGEGTLINSEFWQTVCKKMISSQNTMTEIRLYAFLYTIWNTVVCDLGRKSDLCIGLLLDPEIFESRFNHWCPMVRSYYMRLLCWRVGRFDGEAKSGDVMILETMLQRLQSVWANYLYLREQAEKKRSLPPPTNPCHPAPGRRLLIIRTDTQVAPGNSFLSFDGLGPRETNSNQAQLQAKRFSTLSNLVEMDTRLETSHSSSDSELVGPREKGIGGFFRKMMGSSKNRSKSQGPAPRPNTTQQVRPPAADDPQPATTLTRSATEDLQMASQHRSSVVDLSIPRTPGTPAAQHRNFTFKFSLEYHPNHKHVPGPLRLLPPRLPMAAQIFLQAQSHKANPASERTGPVEPKGASVAHARYCGRALAEWMVVVGECQSFFERRRNEGVPGNKLVETPTLGVEVFRRPS
ncbi:hypothetical protein LTR36_006994 [Oleoguttula mirabilis]|uniref:DUF1765-domain-containing protein n=1 Tax=Oleoguttula mirabilis TaxID=1507867 RepID=A0AAV9JAI2_9PEZI|nr:hypothetical protein LTR36_006994 [Oleoguttula mirabilis]